MNVIHPKARKADLAATHVLAQLLEQLEINTLFVSAEQQRMVVSRLASELVKVEPGQALGALLDSHPAAAELYENVNFPHTGLCRFAPEALLASKQRATVVLERAMHRVMNRSPNSLNKEDPTHGKS